MIRITQRTETLEQYLRDVKKYPLLTIEEEIEISYKSRNGCNISFSKLVSSNLRFVISVAKEYQYQGIQLMDLIQEGNIGLVKAAKRFDETRGFKFISYAVWWIRQAIQEKLRVHNRVINLPINKYREIKQIRDFVNYFMCSNGRNPSLQEITDNLEIKKIDTIDFYKVLSFDAPLNTYKYSDSNDNTLLDLFTNESDDQYNSYIDDLKKDIKRIFKGFSSRDTLILNHYYGLHEAKQLPMSEIAIKLGLTRERVRQIIKSNKHTLKTLRRKSGILKKYL